MIYTLLLIAGCFYAYRLISYINLQRLARRLRSGWAPPIWQVPFAFGLDRIYRFTTFNTTFKNFEFFESCFEQYGDTFSLSVFGKYILITVKCLMVTRTETDGGA